MTEKRPIYNRIKAVLAEKAIPSLELAKKLGKNRATVSKWCTNETQPSIETLFQIAKALNIDARQLLVSIDFNN